MGSGSNQRGASFDKVRPRQINREECHSGLSAFQVSSCFMIGPDLLIVDDFALKKLSSQATSDFYDLLIERHTRSSTILTSDRGVEEWMAVFDDPMLGQSALDRFCHRAHQFVIEGEPYRKRTAPGSKTTPKTGGKATT